MGISLGRRSVTLLTGAKINNALTNGVVGRTWIRGHASDCYHPRG